MVVEKRKGRPKYKAWECGTCTKLLGLIYPNGTLAVKHKDLVLWVVGQAKTVCRFCQTINTYRTTLSIEDISDNDDVIDSKET